MSGGGMIIAETDDAKALYSWLAYWNDLLEFQTTPCVSRMQRPAKYCLR